MNILNAQKRTPGINLNVYRKEGKIPAVLYGHGFDSVQLLLLKSEFIKMIRNQGKGGLMDLKIDTEETHKVLLQDYQAHPITQDFIHADLYRIRMDEKLRTTVQLAFLGESPAVKQGGVLIKNYTEIEVECLPKDLVSEIEVDLSLLNNVHDSIKIEDLAFSPGVSVLAPKSEVIVTVADQAVEEIAVSTADEKAQEQAKIEELGKEKEKEDTKAEGEKKGK